MSIHAHKQIIEISRPNVGLKGFIAIHSEVLGPAVGGTRMYPYAARQEALADVLQLSRAMTYKCAIAGVRYGGGKGVIIADPRKKTNAMLRAYAEEINKLNGHFYTGEDVGLSEEDVVYMHNVSKFFIGSKAGDPSQYAALSTLISMKSASRFLNGSGSMSGVHVVVKGIGKAGKSLVELLLNEGAEVTISDIDESVVRSVKNSWPEVDVVDPNEAHKKFCDIFSPSALGNELTLDKVEELNTKIICGVANNQLADSSVGKRLFELGILYVPDYVANAGGLINVVDELDKRGYDRNRVLQKINEIDQLTTKILNISKQRNISPHIISDTMVEGILNDAVKENKIISEVMASK